MPHNPNKPLLGLERPYEYPNENYDPFASQRVAGDTFHFRNENPDDDFGGNDPLVRRVPFHVDNNWITQPYYNEGPEQRQQYRDWVDSVRHKQLPDPNDINLPNQSGHVDPRLKGLINAKPR